MRRGTKLDFLVVEVDQTGEVAGLNPAARRFLKTAGLKKAEVAKILPHDFKAQATRCRARQSGLVYSQSSVGDIRLLWIFHPSPDNTWVEIHGLVLSGGTGDSSSKPAKDTSFREIVESSPDFFYVHDSKGIFQYLSPNARELLGVNPDEEALHWSDVISDNPVNLRGAELTERALRTGEKQPRYELELKLPDGRLMWVEISESPLIRDGRVVGIMGSAHDITERIEVAATLRESEERYRQLIERSPICIGIVRDGRLAYINPQGAKLLGYPVDEIVGKNAWAFAHPDEQEILRDRVLRRMAGERVAERYELRVVTKSGEARWLDISIVPVEYGGRRAVIGHAIDITERKQAEQSLLEAEARYRDLYENATDIIYTHDLDFRLLSVNARGEKVLGWSVGEHLGKDLRDIIHPDSRTIAERAVEDKLMHPDRPSAPYEIQIYAADGKTRWLEVSSRLIMGTRGPVAVTGIARDITERKRLEAQLRQAQKMEALGQLAGGVAHDFNNLLTGIMGYARLLTERCGQDVKALEDLDQISRAAERAADLTRQLLAFSRQQPFASIRLDLNEVVRSVTNLLSRTVGKHIQIKTDLATDLEPVRADPAQIEQVLLNLTVNARDAMPQGGEMTIHTTMVEIDARFAATHPWAKRGRYARLSVADTGVGMQPNVRERVFEPFFTTKPPERGTGLGLAIVYGIIKQHDGLVDLESMPGRGTAFHLYLPVAEQAAEAPKTEPPRFFRGGHERILLAEDETIVRHLATEVLTEAGYTVTAVEDGEQALRLVREDPDKFDLAILDMIMPKKGGVEVWKAIQTVAPSLAVLLTSGYTPDSVEPEEGTSSQPLFLPKPFAPETLLDKVREALDATGSSRPKAGT